ncbi:SLOG family protein [Azospirillum argentinense]|uniref:SLOG family protein n=1 Tax=Azospirillum argentinense TaxID=2970906 RepID=UPI003564604D
MRWGRVEYTDHHRIWRCSTRCAPSTRHGAAARRQPEGAERIAACWAEHREVTQVLFRPTGRATPRPSPSSATTAC